VDDSSGLTAKLLIEKGVIGEAEFKQKLREAAWDK
jgi:hypothetical protein